MESADVIISSAGNDARARMAAFQHFLGVIRAPFLTLPITLVASGAAASAYDGAFRWSATAVALVGLVALHSAVNALNEASDMRTGIDLKTERTPFSGGSGTLPAGHLSERTAWIVGYGAFAVGAVCGVWFIYDIGWVLFPLFLAGAVCVLAYTDVFARIGIGEIAAGLGLGALPVAGTAMVQEGTLGPAAIAASIPAFFMTFNLLFLNEFPDEIADRDGGRKNLVIMLGRKTAALTYSLAAIAVPVVIILATLIDWLPWLCLLAALPALLLVQPLRWALSKPEEPVPLPALGSNVVWILSTNTVLAATLIAAGLTK
jgi:1,4-dihydroxy-2-naphthoate octaprenyltransferase